MAREHILIVDDKVEISKFISDLLQPLGYILSIANSGKDGLAQALDKQPDLILTDLNMPGMSGLEMLEALHRHDCRVPVILMTLYGSEDIAVRAFRLGVRNYIAKPFDINELLTAIEWALAEGRLRREREQLTAELNLANRSLQQRMRELTTLQAIGRSVAALMSKDELLRRILDAAIYLTRADVGAVFLLDGSAGELHLEAVCQGKDHYSNLRTRLQDSHAEDALRSGQPLWISGPTRRTGVTAYLGQRAHSLLYVPLKLGDKALGVIGVACLHENQPLPPQGQSYLTVLADYAAIALSNARLYEESQQQARQITAVNRIAQTVVSSLDLKKIMQVVVHDVRASLHTEAATLVLLDETSGELVFEIVLGDEEAQAQGPFRMEVEQGIVGWVVRQGRSLRINDVSQDPRFHSAIDRTTGFQTRSVLCVPLSVSDKVIGAIEAINKLDAQSPEGLGRFRASDEELLRGAAAFVAMAVENARLHAAMREAVASQTLQETVVALSHYVNNPLQALLGAAEMLKTDLGDAYGGRGEIESTVAQVAELIRQKAQEIAVVISVLRDITSPESTVYLGSIQMLDIERELQARLASAAEGRM